MDLRHLCFAAVLPLFGCTTLSDRPPPEVVKELAPTGKLRFGVVAAPEPTSFFVVKGADGQPRGVTVDLGRELGRRLGVPVEFTVASTSGDLAEALVAGTLDAAFMPPDDERRKRLDFSTLYVVAENTYLVAPGSAIQTLADVDKPGVRVVAIVGTTTIRTATRVLKTTTPQPVKSVDEAVESLRTGKADAFALTRDSLLPLLPQLPGARILDGSFNRIGVAMAVPKNKPNALAYVTAFVEGAKASGFVQRAFDNAGLKNVAVAGPGER